MARPSNALREFANLYVNGPVHIRGQWDVCANAAGLLEPPERANPMVRRLVQEAGGVVAATDAPPMVPATPLDLEELFAETDKGIPWKQLRSKLTDVIRSVADGTVRATAAQNSMLQFIIKKAEEEAADEDEVSNVIVLPTQGSNQTFTIDKEWMRKIKSLETPQDA